MKFPTRLVTKADSADYQSFTEADIAILEEFMEEALNMAGTGTNGGRLSGYAPSVASTRTAGNTNIYRGACTKDVHPFSALQRVVTIML